MIPAPSNFQLLSTEFLNDSEIPRKFTCHGLDISPALAWSQPPAGTKSFAVTMEDPDAPNGLFTHWLVYNLAPTTAGISENLPKSPNLPDGALQGKNDFGRIGYSGPRPPTGKAHKYVFTIYALNSILKCKPGASRTDLANAMKERIVEKAQLAARYQTSPQAEAVEDDEDSIMKAEKSRLEALGKNPDYLIKTHKLQEELKKAYSLNRSKVEEFFRTVAFFRRPAKVQEFLNAIDDRGVRRILEDYLTYADRYRVYFRLRTDPLEFKPRAWPQYGVKFHGKIVDDQLQPQRLPFVPGDDDSIVEYFSADDLDLAPEINKLVDAGKATFFRIDEKESYSILRQLEDIALKDEGVAIIEHNAEQPYFIIICGPKMNKPLLAKLGPALTEFQRDHYHESFGGRTRDLARLKRDLEADKEPTSQKEKAIDAVGTDEKKLNAERVRLSNLKKKIRQTRP
jgi:Raf kinase inhibitor-like YbhB/YbcL family protein